VTRRFFICCQLGQSENGINPKVVIPESVESKKSRPKRAVYKQMLMPQAAKESPGALQTGSKHWGVRVKTTRVVWLRELLYQITFVLSTAF
jgi:hypothetical protein